jgi:hypothetical protein
MGYKRARLATRWGLVALVSMQLTACATVREVTRTTGTTLGGLGALAVFIAMSPSCDPDTDDCPNDEPYYDEESLDARVALIAGGGAAMLVGGGLVAAAQPPSRRKRPLPKPAPPVVSAQPPETPGARQVRALIEKRCVPQGSIDLRVPSAPDEPRSTLPACD